jgi:integrase
VRLVRKPVLRSYHAALQPENGRVARASRAPRCHTHSYRLNGPPPFPCFAFVAPPLAHTWPTLRPGMATRLVLPSLGYGATGAPDLGLARQLPTAELAVYWGNSAAGFARHSASQRIAGLLHVALGTAVRWKLLKVNSATACQLPRVERTEAKALDPTQAEWLLSAAQGHWLHPIIALATATGCRRGEFLALAWPDVDFNSTPAVITVSKSVEQTKAGLRIKRPKNGKTRAFPVPASAADVLRTHREEQEQHRRLFGATYQTALDIVFAGPDGEYLKPDSVTAAACLLATKAGLKGVGLHSLRHSHASQLLSDGVPLPTVSKRLGHSSVNITAQIYSHAFRQDEIDAASTWEATIGKILKGSQVKQ